MKRLCAVVIIAAVALALASAGCASRPRRSEDAAAQHIDRCAVAPVGALGIEHVTIRAADAVPAGSFTPPGARAPLIVAAFCRVQASVATSDDSLVNFEVWDPSSWNGKIVVTGNGGYGNALSYGDMAYAMAQGYAVVGGDTGHQTVTSDDLQWGAGHPERILDWGSRSIHAITEPSRRIVVGLKGRSVNRSYFYGCSTGGHQAYAEMQRYPQDFDGLIAGAPGNNRVRLNAGFLWQFLSNHSPGDDATPIVPASKLPLVTKAAVAACDAVDGVSDGVVDDPRSCRFDPAVLTCSGADGADCLTRAQVSALNRMYAGASNLRTGERVYPGWPKTSEALTTLPDGRPGSGWHQYWGTREPMRVNFWRSWVFARPDWNWTAFDFDRDLAEADRTIGTLVDQTSTDLSTFKTRGAKAIVYQGWQDPVVNAIDTIAYYERVRTRQGSQDETGRFLRLFMVPGMGHCSGGTGTTNFGNEGGAPPIVDAEHDLLSALDAWVLRGRAPDRLIASRLENGAVVRTRPLCAYPMRAVYRGSGSTDDATSFVCR